jgi:HAD superfamily hydrolase (TIGR01484 family)
VVGVMTDIDDTLTTDGVITPDALRALHDLKAAGLAVIAITGRPVGWSEPFAQSWPVDAIVAENGAVALVKNHEIDQIRMPDKRDLLSKIYIQDAATRRINVERMRTLALKVLAEVPGAHLAEDSGGRETDIAIDHSEFHHLSHAEIVRVVAILEAGGMHATVSSIHINGWFGSHNKWVGACWIVDVLFGRALSAEVDRWVYVGDSTNDQRMFKAIPQSVGVSNIRRFEAELTFKPQYVAENPRGAGFSEVTRTVLEALRPGTADVSR